MNEEGRGVINDEVERGREGGGEREGERMGEMGDGGGRREEGVQQEAVETGNQM